MRQLEDVQQQFEWEHERHRNEMGWQLAVIEKLKQELASEQEKRLSGVISLPRSSRLSVCVPKKSGEGEVTAVSLEKHVGLKETSKRVTLVEPIGFTGSESPVGSTLTYSKWVVSGGKGEVTTRPAQCS